MIIGESILVIGGVDSSLNPVVIHLNEAGAPGLERCQTGKYERRDKAVSEFLNDKFVVCGGYGTDYWTKEDCEAIDDTGIFNNSAFGRMQASSIKLDQSTMWITGGYDFNINHLNTTEIVTLEGSIDGESLPFTVYGHCMVQYRSDSILLIGGSQNGNEDSDKTWIIDPTNDFNMTEGPSLKQGRMYHSCGKMKDEYGNVIVIVAGGYGMNSVERLNTTHMKEWVKG